MSTSLRTRSARISRLTIHHRLFGLVVGVLATALVAASAVLTLIPETPIRLPGALVVAMATGGALAYWLLGRTVGLLDAERALLLAREHDAARLKDELLAAVSHELRTPLHAIVGWTQVLATTPATPATESLRRRALEIISRNAHAEARVVADLVDVSRLAAGTLTLHVSTFDLREVAAAAVEAIRTTADARAIALTVALPPAPAIVRGDRQRLRQVIWHVLSNAVKFTPSGGLVILRVIGGRARHVVRITDSGQGIAAEFLPYVFDRFRRADGSSGGLGLGLSLAKEIAELHGGSLQASSRGRRKGATFTLQLPAHDARTSPAAAGHRPVRDSSENAPASHAIASVGARR